MNAALDFAGPEVADAVGVPIDVVGTVMFVGNDWGSWVERLSMLRDIAVVFGKVCG